MEGELALVMKVYQSEYTCFPLLLYIDGESDDVQSVFTFGPDLVIISKELRQV